MSAHPELADLAADITTHIGYVDVVAQGWGSPLPYSCEQIITEQEWIGQGNALSPPRRFYRQMGMP